MAAITEAIVMLMTSITFLILFRVRARETERMSMEGMLYFSWQFNTRFVKIKFAVMATVCWVVGLDIFLTCNTNEFIISLVFKEKQQMFVAEMFDLLSFIILYLSRRWWWERATLYMKIEVTLHNVVKKHPAFHNHMLHIGMNRTCSVLE